MRDAVRHRDRRLEELNAQLEAAGPQALGGVAAGQRLIVQTLPFVHLMLSLSRGTHPTLSSLPHSLMKLIMELQAPVDSELFRAGAAADGVTRGGGGDAGAAAAEAAAEAWSSSLAEDPIED